MFACHKTYASTHHGAAHVSTVFLNLIQKNRVTFLIFQVAFNPIVNPLRSAQSDQLRYLHEGFLVPLSHHSDHLDACKCSYRESHDFFQACMIHVFLFAQGLSRTYTLPRWWITKVSTLTRATETTTKQLFPMNRDLPPHLDQKWFNLSVISGLRYSKIW